MGRGVTVRLMSMLVARMPVQVTQPRRPAEGMASACVPVTSQAMLCFVQGTDLRALAICQAPRLECDARLRRRCQLSRHAGQLQLRHPESREHDKSSREASLRMFRSIDAAVLACLR